MLKHWLGSIALAIALVAGMCGWTAAAPLHRGFAGPQQTFGPHFQPSWPVHPAPSRIHPGLHGLTHWVRYWNQVAIDTSGLDHTPVAPGDTRVFGEQFGRCRASRAMAIVHIAMFDALDAIYGGYRGYTNIRPAPAGASAQAAIAQAAHNTLAALFPSQTPRFRPPSWPMN